MLRDLLGEREVRREALQAFIAVVGCALVGLAVGTLWRETVFCVRASPAAELSAEGERGSGGGCRQPTIEKVRARLYQN